VGSGRREGDWRQLTAGLDTEERGGADEWPDPKFDFKTAPNVTFPRSNFFK
jgi:hypothetical protein